jgi:hypothetical protein
MGSDTFPLYQRFKLNEAYPAISTTTLSTTVGSDGLTIGQHNLLIDWQSSLHTISGCSAITDTGSAYGMSFKSLSSNGTMTVTFRNIQSFRPGSGASVDWVNTDVCNGSGAVLESGTATVSSTGAITVPSISVKTGGTRVALSVSGGGGPVKRRSRFRAP